MKASWKMRFRFWLCRKLGHKKQFSHHHNQDWYSCKRCGRLVGESE